MKKLLISTVAVASLFAATNVDSLQKQINSLQAQLKQVKADQKAQNDRYYKKVAPVVTNSHLFWSYDLRSSFDYIHQKTTDGMTYNAYYDTHGNMHITSMTPAQGKDYYNRLLSNRVILTGLAKPNENLKGTIQIEANNLYGASDAANPMDNPFQNISWVQNETPDDTTIRVKTAYFNYYFGDGYMLSLGRRPATNGFPANLRDGDSANSPLGHLINMEFDGLSFEIGNDVFSRVSSKFADWGTWLKFCAGRGYSDATGKWPTSNIAYESLKSQNGLGNMDFAGFLLIPYDNGQYSLKTETVWAWNIEGYGVDTNPADANTGDMVVYSMQNFGNYFGENVVFTANGVGNGISDYLDNTIAFVSFAMSKTDDKNVMIGQDPATGAPIYAEGHVGTSIWVGADMPGIGENDRWGLNYVHGSKYWRSFTYGEDTLVGSIAAVRGNAFEAYYIGQVVPNLTAELRATVINYSDPGSDGFFGMSMDPDMMSNFSYVERAEDIRASIRYQF